MNHKILVGGGLGKGGELACWKMSPLRRKFLLLFVWLSLSYYAFAQSEVVKPVNITEGNSGTEAPSADSRCFVTIDYMADLGSGPNTDQVALNPIVVNSIRLKNEENVNIRSWRLGWEYPYGSVIKSPQDIFQAPFPGPALISEPDISGIILESIPGRNMSIKAGNMLQFGFVTSKDEENLTSENNESFGVGAPQNMAFNNLICSLTSANSTGEFSDETQSLLTNNVSIEYAPIQYRNESLIGDSTQLLVRIRNMENVTSLDLGDISFQYWFNGPNGSVIPSILENPWNFFRGRCIWSTVGCENIVMGIAKGYPDALGAHFALNVSFASNAGTLQATGEGALSPVFLPVEGLDVADVLLEISTVNGESYFDPYEDYSFEDTPVLEFPDSDTYSIIPRKAIKNPRIPAYLNGRHVWGILPKRKNATMIDVVDEGNGRIGRVVCEAFRGGTQLSCSLQAMYCCKPANPFDTKVLTYAPEVFPPLGAPPINLDSNEIGAPSPENESGTLPLPPPFNPNLNTEQQSQGGGGSSLAWIAGVAVGVAASVIIAASGLVLLKRRRRQSAIKSKSDQYSSNGTTKFPDTQAGEKDIESMQSNEIAKRSSNLSFNGEQKGLQAFPGMSLPGTKDKPYVRALPDSPNGILTKEGFQGSPASFGSHSAYGSSPYHPNSNTDIGSPGFSRGPTMTPHAGPLHKFPSGLSGITGRTGSSFASSGQMNIFETFESDTQPRYPNHLDVNYSHSTQHSYSKVDDIQASDCGGPGPLPDNITLILERKSHTSPSLLLCGSSNLNSSGKNKVNDEVYSDNEMSSLCASPNEGYELELDPVEPWQIKRSKSWDGLLHDTLNSDEWSFVQKLKRQRAPTKLSSPLPPMSSLPPPILPSAGPALDVDLNVDSAEIEGNLGKCLGTGGFGSVYEAEWRGKKVAVKKLPPFTSQDPGDPNPGQAAYEALLREIQLASKFNSDRLVRVFGGCTGDKTKCCLIMELVSGGNLFHRIYDRRRRRLTYLEILQLAHDIAEGLSYIHPLIIHRDLKPQNILLDENGRAKIADFGISRIKDPAKSYLTQVTTENGTPMYMAPEQMNGTRLDEKVDVYALGCILNEAWTRRQPWRDSSHFFQIILKVAINGERPWVDPDCPEPLKRLITKCWHQDPRVRPSAAEVVRLTELMMQEELVRWEMLSNRGSSGLRYSSAGNKAVSII